jgi:hypothetical protein
MFRKLVAWITLFGSASTLLCCALPALFVSLGAGAAFASLVTRFPQLIWVSEHKTGVFLFAGTSLAVAGVLQWNARNLPCPTDPALARACASSRRWSLGIYCGSVVIFCVGVLFAYVAPSLMG